MYGVGAPPSSNITVETIVTVAPPALPVYVQPDAPGPEYIWTPGYWAYDNFFEDYYWVPGTWVRAPRPGYLWTPGYWYWGGGRFIFSQGYWGSHIGFYGGINYGWGYSGRGYRRNVTNVTNITNNTTSYSGGPGGIKAQPTTEERAAMKEKHIPATAEQKMHVQAARKNPALRASMNHGKPAIAATARLGVFKGKGVVEAKQAGAFYNKTNASAKRAAAKHAAAKHKPAPRPHKKPKPEENPKGEIKKPEDLKDQSGQ
jgi:hypothetical protein